jgi:putative hydrolase of the HAD superfamily
LALIFDFDGLILDTETARYYAWKEVMESHGVELPLSFWQQNVGLPSEAFDPAEYLERMAKAPIDKESVRQRKQEIFESRMKNESLRPGIREYLDEARKQHIKLAICSSSPRKWVVSNLSRFEIEDVFDAIVTGTEVPNLKPAPDLYLKALEALRLPAEACIAFEDSPKGIESAKAARIFCVAVANPMTEKLSLDEADLALRSLADVPLDELEKKFLAASPE